MAADRPPNATDLVMTQADLPPGVDAPAPPVAEAARAADRPSLSPDLLRDIERLADRVGGLDRLREIVDTLAGMSR